VSGGSFVSPATRQRVRGWAVPIATALGRLGLTPNALTVIGFIGTCGAAVAAAAQQWILAGVLVLLFGIFDLFDGALARATGRASKFGAFLDSTLDRTGENLVYAGIAFGCAVDYYPLGVGLAALAVAFASVVTYSRAKAEVVGLHGEVGFAPREVRLVILTIGLVGCGIVGGLDPSAQLSLPPPESAGNVTLAAALGLIALLSAITIVQRIVHVRHQLGNEQ
jgi:CDP-diacylglycerol--glycerol-3-phosphate 3-phosphatidyltransferase